MTYVIIIILLALSALFSGLTLGLMGLDAHELKRKASLGDSAAARLYPIRVNGNLLLTTLLVGNVLVNSILSIFLGSLTSGILAAIIATTLIVIFGEIIPQALFNRHALVFGARLAWMVDALLILMYPATKPIAWMLDKVLGDELPTIYSKHELMKIIEEHEDAHESDLDADEERIIRGALTFSDTAIEDIMTSREDVYALDASRKLSKETLEEIREWGFSRVPVYRGDLNAVIGILYTADLIGFDAYDKTVADMTLREVHAVHASEQLDNVLRRLIRSNRHLRIVRDDNERTVGVVTLEDILEEVIRTEINDERDEA